jgi:hypothetical protein
MLEIKNHVAILIAISALAACSSPGPDSSARANAGQPTPGSSAKVNPAPKDDTHNATPGSLFSTPAPTSPPITTPPDKAGSG